MSLKHSNHTTQSLASSSSHSKTQQLKRTSSASSEAELRCLAKLRNALKEDPSLRTHVNPIMVYRFAVFHSFDYDAALSALKQNYQQRDLHCSVVYMRPSRFTPLDTQSTSKLNLLNTTTPRGSRKKSHDLIIDNLCYVLNDMSQTKEQCRNGIAFIANMEGWTMKNFSQDYCFQFMEALQGKMVPTKVELFLIVNPPKWFGKIFKIMKPMLSKSFSKKTHIIQDDQLGEFLMEGYERHLPDEFQMGLVRSEEILEDYVDLKRYEG